MFVDVVLRKSQQIAVEEDILPAAQVAVEACADFDKGGNSALYAYLSRGGLQLF